MLVEYLQQSTGTPLDDAEIRRTPDGQLLVSDQRMLRAFIPSRGTLDTISEGRLVPSPRGGGELILRGIRNGTELWQLAARRKHLGWGYQGGGAVIELAALLHALRTHGPTADTSHLNYQQAQNEGLDEYLAGLTVGEEATLRWPW